MPGNSTESPPTLYFNGRIFTADFTQPWAEAMLVSNGKILAVGSEADVRTAIAETAVATFNLAGRFVMPGLCDSHIHLYDTILAARTLQLAGAASLPDMLARIQAYAAQVPPDGWLRGQGWNESRWPEPVYPTCSDLDPVIPPGISAIFWRSDMHVAVCNSAALQHAGITPATPDPPGGTIDRTPDGAPNGLLYDRAIDLIAPTFLPLKDAALDEAILQTAAKLHTLGITAIHDQRLQSGQEGPHMLAAYRRLHAAGKLPLRIHCNLSATHLNHAIAQSLHTGLGDEWLRIGHVKFFIDGSLGSRTAWMLAPYEAEQTDEADKTSQASSPNPGLNTGLCVTPVAQLRTAFQQAMQNRLAISIHAIGDRANREVLDLFEEILPGAPLPPAPHRIEHVQILSPQDIPRLGALKLTASVQPVHMLDDMEIGTRYLGKRAAYSYAFRSLAQHGARLVFGSDAPVADLNPLLGIHAAVQRCRPQDPLHATWYPDEAIDLAMALRAYTVEPAAAVGCSHLYGTLKPGMTADFVVLNEDPFKLLESCGPTANLAGITVAMTVLAGKHVYAQA